MTDTEDYWIINNKFIFNPKFNSCIDIYIDLLSQYNELIYSNYVYIERNNKYDIDKNYIGSKFNQEVKLPENL